MTPGRNENLRKAVSLRVAAVGGGCHDRVIVQNNPVNLTDPQGLAYGGLPTNPSDVGALPYLQNPQYPHFGPYDKTFYKGATLACHATSDALNSQAGQIDEAFPPGTTTGHPVTDAALLIYSIGKFIWNGIFK